MANPHEPHAAAHDHAHAHTGAHVHGQMDISDQERTFESFIKFWVVVFGASIGILIFLALFNS